MGVWSRLVAAFAADAPDVTGPTMQAPETARRFSIGLNDVDPALFGLTAYTTSITPEPPVSRAEAIQVPAVTRARQMICTIGTLPLYTLASDFTRGTRTLLEQPERDIPRSVTMTFTVEDMLFHGVAWWRITERDFIGRPTHVRRLDASTVDPRAESQVYVRSDGSSQGSAWEYVPDRDLIRFDSPNDGLLSAGARAIRTCARLDAAAARRAESPIPTGYFESVEGADPFALPAVEGETEDEYAERQAEALATFLSDWADARQARATAWVPAGLKYVVTQSSAHDLQLAEQRQHAVLQIANVAGLDADYLSASPAGRSNDYDNGQDRRRALIDFTLAAYMAAIQDRLSMEDVTPRGQEVRFDLTGFLAGDELTRMETYIKAAEAGAYGPEEVRRREELPDDVAPASAAPVRPLRALPSQTEEAPVAASADGTGPTFDAEAPPTGLSFATDDLGPTFEVNRERRTIYGLAVPYGVVGKSNGQRFVFTRGSLTLPSDVGRVKLLIGHDRSQAVGRAIELTEDETGLWATFKVARGPEGDRALAMAEDKVWDGLSVGLAEGGQYERRNGVAYPRGVPLAETSLTPFPAYGDARISAVAASADDPKGTAMSGTETGTDTTTPAEAPAPVTEAPAAPTFDAAQAAQFAAFQAWQASQGAPAVPEPAAQETFHVPAAGRPVVMVTESLPYRFDAGRGFVSGGEFDFSADLQRASLGDYAATQRVLGFTGQALEAAEQAVTFDIDTSDGATLNPSRQRPDLYVGQKAFQYPLWNAVRKESIKDKTPFVLPKRNTSTINVAVHTEGVEPTGASATWTSQTVTPDAISGKVEITRELWDQVGTPAVSNRIWAEYLDAWYVALEARVVTVLNAASPTGISLTAGGGTTGQTLSAELAAAFASLQFIRGGFSMDTFAAQIDLYKAIVGALDDTGRQLFPILGPSNANGQAQPRFRTVNVHGVEAFGSHALAATGSVVASSYLFDRADVYGAASAPNRLEFQYRVAYVDLALWGYAACAITDITGVREITYDPVA